MEFAIGSVGKVLVKEFEVVDTFRIGLKVLVFYYKVLTN